MSKKKILIISKSIASAMILILGILTYQGSITQNMFSRLVIVIMAVLLLLEITLKYLVKRKKEVNQPEKK